MITVAIEDPQKILRPLPLTDESRAFASPHGVISGIAFSPEGGELALACRDGTIVVCPLKPRGIRTVIQGHSGRIWSVAISPDGKTLASAAGEWSGSNRGGGLKLWDLASGRERAGLSAAGDDIFSVAFSPDGKTLASGGRDKTVRLWDAASGRLLHICRGHDGLVRSVTFHPDGRTIVSAGHDGTIRFWDTVTGRASRDPIHLLGIAPNSVVVSRDGKTLAANTASGYVQRADSKEEAARSSEPGRTLAGIKIWDWTSAKERRVLIGCETDILGLAFSPDSRFLASAGGLNGALGEVKLWDLATGELIASLKGHRDWVESVAVSPDGKTLVSAGGSAEGPGEIKLWDLRTLTHPEPARMR
jgi:WD40 repeat protein